MDKLRLPLIVLAALACLATPAQRYEREFPEWAFDTIPEGKNGPELGFECARVSAWVSKSGKQGMGVSFEIENLTPDPCPVEFTYAAFVPGGLTVRPVQMPRTLDMKDEDRADAYLGFAFDNEALWNEGRRTGVLYVTLKIRGEVKEYQLPMTHKLDEFQRLRYPTSRPVQKQPT